MATSKERVTRAMGEASTLGAASSATTPGGIKDLAGMEILRHHGLQNFHPTSRNESRNGQEGNEVRICTTTWNAEEREREYERRREAWRASTMDFSHLRVNAQDLAMALEYRPHNGLWLLNLETGEVAFVEEDELHGDEAESYEDPEHYLPIEAMESFESFRFMEDFVAALPKGGPRRDLEAALNHRKPFRAFKDALLNHLALREAWFKYHDGRMAVRAQEWIEENLPGTRLA
jgi:hypothetical protein